MPRLLCVSCVVLTFGLLAAGSAAAFPGANGVLVFEGSGGLTTVAENEFRDPNGALVEKRYDIVASVIVTTANVSVSGDLAMSL